MITLGIETSCDETAAAVVAPGPRVLSNIIHSQIPDHAPHGGVVPEIASRAHVEVLPDILRRAVLDAGLEWTALDQIAVTAGPGLAGALLIGVSAAQALALALDRPLVTVHHIEAHLHSLFLAPELPADNVLFPVAALVVSGGHTSLMRLDSRRSYALLGRSLDDAAGECLDKGAKLMGLPYPGGPEIERLAESGDPLRFRFPRGIVTDSGTLAKGLAADACFSFSGLKTALRYFLRDHPDRVRDALPDIAAGYQHAVISALVERLVTVADRIGARTLACAGGVARNRILRNRLAQVATDTGRNRVLTPPGYCTDNAAMIAAAAVAGWGRAVTDPARLDIYPTWPLAGVGK